MAVLARAGAPVTSDGVWGAWSLDPSLLLLLAAVAAVYARTVHGLWRTGGRGAGISQRRVLLFVAGMLVLLVALVSPVEALSESLFAAHMVQHLLLTLVAAPLLLLGRVHLGLVPALPLAWRRRGARRLARVVRRAPAAVVVTAVGLHVLVLVLWHVPVLYDAAIADGGLHVAEHATLLLTALGYWAVMGAARSRPVPVAGLAAFVTSLVSVLLAATLTAATQPWYAAHLGTAPWWGLTALEDQHLAAAIMWIPGGLVHLGAATAAIHYWIRADERRLALQRRATPPVP